MTIKVGDKVPAGTMHTMTAEGPGAVTTDELFSGKKVALFSVPGAFTPTCSAKHLPSFVNHAADLTAKGVDTIACMSVNDAFVMGVWGKDQKADGKVMMLADGNADYSKGAWTGVGLFRLWHGFARQAVLHDRRRWRRQPTQYRRRGLRQDQR